MSPVLALYILGARENSGKEKNRIFEQVNLAVHQKYSIAFVRTTDYNIIKRRKGWFRLMAQKSANLYARIEPDVKEQAERILAALGVPASNAINMFYKQIILHKGIPFDVKLPASEPISLADMDEEALSRELEKGYSDMKTGKVKPAKDVFAGIRKDYGL